MKKLFIFLILLVSSTFAQVDSDVTQHYKDGEKHAFIAVGYLAGGMILVPIEEYLCHKYGIGPKTEGTIKVVSGLVMGSLSLYYAGNAAHDVWWIQLKTQREF